MKTVKIFALLCILAATQACTTTLNDTYNAYGQACMSLGGKLRDCYGAERAREMQAEYRAEADRLEALEDYALERVELEVYNAQIDRYGEILDRFETIDRSVMTERQRQDYGQAQRDRRSALNRISRLERSIADYEVKYYFTEAEIAARMAYYRQRRGITALR